jgi:superfamily II DNA or RNA helicase
MKLRPCQQEARDEFRIHKGLSFFAEGAPGIGKTILAGAIALDMLERGEIDFVIAIVPTTVLKGDRDSGFLGDWHKVGLEITTVLKQGQGRPKEFSGAVITYQQLPNMLATLETWVSNGTRLFFVFDEIHHAADHNEWGSAVESCGRMAKKILAMSGTPFRGDGRRISFITYDKNGMAAPDFRYTYREAVRDRICRPVNFLVDDGLAQYVIDENQQEIRISEAKEEELSAVTATVFSRDSKWLKEVIEKADDKLDEYRITSINAGGLIICRAGKDDNDDKYLHHVAGLVKKVTGEIPEVITHDDPDANAKIERFRKASGKWICAVRMISEGVDIKRLRVLVLANRPTTELLFRQVVGRVVRVEDEKRPGDATVFMAKFLALKEWAECIQDEAQAGLKDEKEKLQPREGDNNPGESNFTPIGSTHEDGGAISFEGEMFTADEIGAAEQLKRGDPALFDHSVMLIAHILKKAGVKPEPSTASPKPLQLQKKELRMEINKLVRKLAVQRNPDKPDFKGIWVDLHKFTGADDINDLTDNFDIVIMRQVMELLKNWLGGDPNVYAA